MARKAKKRGRRAATQGARRARKTGRIGKGKSNYTRQGVIKLVNTVLGADSAGEIAEHLGISSDKYGPWLTRWNA